MTELGADADPFMLHVYAALAEKEQAMIASRTKAVLGAKRTQGVQLGNRTNLVEAQVKGASANRTTADAFAADVLPVVSDIQARGAVSHRGIAAELNAGRVPTARGGEWTAVQVGRLLTWAA